MLRVNILRQPAFRSSRVRTKKEEQQSLCGPQAARLAEGRELNFTAVDGENSVKVGPYKVCIRKVAVRQQSTHLDEYLTRHRGLRPAHFHENLERDCAYGAIVFRAYPT